MEKKIKKLFIVRLFGIWNTKGKDGGEGGNSSAVATGLLQPTRSNHQIWLGLPGYMYYESMFRLLILEGGVFGIHVVKRGNPGVGTQLNGRKTVVMSGGVK